MCIASMCISEHFGNLLILTPTLCYVSQTHGFTCGFGDLLVVPTAEEARRQKLRLTDNLGDKVHANFVGINETGGDILIHGICCNCAERHNPVVLLVRKFWKYREFYSSATIFIFSFLHVAISVTASWVFFLMNLSWSDESSVELGGDSGRRWEGNANERRQSKCTAWYAYDQCPEPHYFWHQQHHLPEGVDEAFPRELSFIDDHHWC